MALRLLGISGSPRLKATHYAVGAALEHARRTGHVETEYFSVHKQTIGFCTHCDFCVTRKRGCVIDDAVQQLYPMLLRADAVILATPVYQGSVSGQLKTVLDRCRAIVAADPAALRNKVGMGVTVGGDRNGGQEPALQSIIDFLVINDMVPVGGGSFGANLGAAIWSHDEGEEGVRADEEGLAALYRATDRLLDVAQMMRH